MRSTLNAISHGVRSTRCDDAFGAGGTPTTHLATSSASASRQLMGRWLRVVRVVRLPASACSVASALAAVQPPRSECDHRGRDAVRVLGKVAGLASMALEGDAGLMSRAWQRCLGTSSSMRSAASPQRLSHVGRAKSRTRSSETRRRDDRAIVPAAWQRSPRQCWVAARCLITSSERRASSAWRLSISRGAVSRKPASGARGRGIGIGSGRDGTRRTWLVGGVAARDGGRLAH